MPKPLTAAALGAQLDRVNARLHKSVNIVLDDIRAKAGIKKALLQLLTQEKNELTPRELEILPLMRDHSLSNQDIADRLRISVRTVKFHISNILEKSGISSRNEV